MHLIPWVLEWIATKLEQNKNIYHSLSFNTFTLAAAAGHGTGSMYEDVGKTGTELGRDENVAKNEYFKVQLTALMTN